jgi:hypothetical protein
MPSMNGSSRLAGCRTTVVTNRSLGSAERRFAFVGHKARTVAARFDGLGRSPSACRAIIWTRQSRALMDDQYSRVETSRLARLFARITRRSSLLYSFRTGTFKPVVLSERNAVDAPMRDWEDQWDACHENVEQRAIQATLPRDGTRSGGTLYGPRCGSQPGLCP